MTAVAAFYFNPVIGDREDPYSRTGLGSIPDVETNLAGGLMDLGFDLLSGIRVPQRKRRVKDVTLGQVHDAVINWFGHYPELVVFCRGLDLSSLICFFALGLPVAVEFFHGLLVGRVLDGFLFGGLGIGCDLGGLSDEWRH